MVEGYYPGVFDAVQGALPDVPVKPDPTLLNKLMEQLGADRAHTPFVGDSNVDIQTGKNGGLATCGVLWGFRSRRELELAGADHIVEHPGQMAALVTGTELLMPGQTAAGRPAAAAGEAGGRAHGDGVRFGCGRHSGRGGPRQL